MTTTADTRRRRRSALAVVAITALGGLAIAGCGGDDDGSAEPAATTGASETTTEATTTAAQGGGGSTIDLSETDFKLNPSDPTVQAGKVTIKVANDGQVPHNIEVEGPTGEQELESDLAPGDSGTLTVDLSQPGTYEWYCPVGNHKELGMEGEITVE